MPPSLVKVPDRIRVKRVFLSLLWTSRISLLTRLLIFQHLSHAGIDQLAEQPVDILALIIAEKYQPADKDLMLIENITDVLENPEQHIPMQISEAPAATKTAPEVQLTSTFRNVELSNVDGVLTFILKDVDDATDADLSRHNYPVSLMKERSLLEDSIQVVGILVPDESVQVVDESAPDSIVQRIFEDSAPVDPVQSKSFDDALFSTFASFIFDLVTDNLKTISFVTAEEDKNVIFEDSSAVETFAKSVEEMGEPSEKIPLSKEPILWRHEINEAEEDEI